MSDSNSKPRIPPILLDLQELLGSRDLGRLVDDYSPEKYDEATFLEWMQRVRVLERLFDRLYELRSSTEFRLRFASAPEQRKIAEEFAGEFGLGVANKEDRQLSLLMMFNAYFALHGDESVRAEIREATKERREANVDIRVRRAAVEFVREQHDLASFGSTRKQLNDAWNALSEWWMFRLVPIPGGDDD